MGKRTQREREASKLNLPQMRRVTTAEFPETKRMGDMTERRSRILIKRLRRGGHAPALPTELRIPAQGVTCQALSRIAMRSTKTTQITTRPYVIVTTQIARATRGRPILPPTLTALL